ncbi:hypothetical protein SLS62_006025 [Diatrype stigma]|uniref:Uncharacterized protein n=1 Tax=Diatrype stigma TaxID=117547 RepID=A0AAN9YSB0_9PEZI
MAPRRPDKKSKKRAAALSRAAAGDNTTTSSSASPKSEQKISPLVLVRAAEAQLQEGNAEAALALAQSALDQASNDDDDDALLAAVNFLGQACLEVGDLDGARAHCLRAAALDPAGARDEAVGGGAEKFLCLAQLSEEGGRDSVAWFEKGAAALRARIQILEDSSSSRTNTTTSAAARIKRRSTRSSGANASAEQEGEAPEPAETAETKSDAEAEAELLKRKLAMALCSVAEVYMTDLSWEGDAEARCEALVTEATLVAPHSAEAWQTLADVRISQARPDDARAALARSLDLWRALPPDHPGVPAFAGRVALARLLLEVGRERAALEVLERLVAEDDSSVQTWYLGGWGLYVLGEKLREGEGTKNNKNSSNKENGDTKKNGKDVEEEDAEDDDDWRTSWISSRVWLNQCLHLYKLQDYEDERLGEHAQELLDAIAKELGEAPAGGEGDDDDDGVWEDDGDSDEEMQG